MCNRQIWERSNSYINDSLIYDEQQRKVIILDTNCIVCGDINIAIRTSRVPFHCRDSIVEYKLNCNITPATVPYIIELVTACLRTHHGDLTQLIAVFRGRRRCLSFPLSLLLHLLKFPVGNQMEQFQKVVDVVRSILIFGPRRQLVDVNHQLRGLTNPCCEKQ